MVRKKQTKHTFVVGSLIDASAGDYVAVCCAMTGHIIRHEWRGQMFTGTPEPEPEVEPVEESKNVNKLDLFA